jgi:hypothetical protein
MARLWLVDDETCEAITRGDEVDPRFAPLAATARHIEAVGDRPAPPASAELRALFAGAGRSGPVAAAPIPLGRVRVTGRVAGRGRAAKVALGASVAAAGVVGIAGAGAAGVLPEPMRDLVEFLSPIDPPEPSTPADERDDRETDGTNTGPRGATSDGSPRTGDPAGGDPGGGSSTTAATPGPAPAAEDGLDRAAETPAAPRLPTTTTTAGGQDADVPDEPAGPPDTTPAPPQVPGHTPSAPTTVMTSGATAPGTTG